MFQKALVPVDGSPYMDGLVAYAIGFAKKIGCSLTFVYVVNMPPTSAPSDIEKQKVASAKISEGCRKKAADEDVSASSRIEVGSPTEAVINMVEREKFDLIIIASRGYSRLRRLIVGSVADQVMRLAPCPVLVFR